MFTIKIFLTIIHFFLFLFSMELTTEQIVIDSNHLDEPDETGSPIHFRFFDRKSVMREVFRYPNKISHSRMA